MGRRDMGLVLPSSASQLLPHPTTRAVSIPCSLRWLWGWLWARPGAWGCPSPSSQSLMGPATLEHPLGLPQGPLGVSCLPRCRWEEPAQTSGTGVTDRGDTAETRGTPLCPFACLCDTKVITHVPALARESQLMLRGHQRIFWLFCTLAVPHVCCRPPGCPPGWGHEGAAVHRAAPLQAAGEGLWWVCRTEQGRGAARRMWEGC